MSTAEPSPSSRHAVAPTLSGYTRSITSGWRSATARGVEAGRIERRRVQAVRQT
jgi:hypothetical protein